jgi:hypothetical protein
VTKVDGAIIASKYVEIVDSSLWPVIARHFPDDNYCSRMPMLLFIELE